MDRFDLDDLQCLYASSSPVRRKIALYEARIMTKWRKFVEPVLALLSVAAVVLMITGYHQAGFVVGVVAGVAIGAYTLARWQGILK
jgi:hypothetical protein